MRDQNGEYVDIAALQAEADYYDQMAQEQGSQRRMDTINIYRALHIGDHYYPAVTIVIDEEIPEPPPGKLDIKAAGERFDQQAELLCRALSDSLPGGTLTRLIAKLLLDRADVLHVRWGPDGMEVGEISKEVRRLREAVEKMGEAQRTQGAE